ncbi:MAG: elongation factor Ts [Alphaproteobacteria bacterium]|jgi:elongation factor Ts|nr:elongation factor Ts [Alphaproteobacteria bacterium]PPR12661.1 MAG: Elongation factor Ts [Alphaproteobacteria bacterium MarineAlpha12_Bin1]|tara:strand:- start:380 stop:1303 length:924 start_codon:yes stop_codon:yes gene_type:complete
MAEITARMVKELRDKSGAGMMDCKSALVETDGDLDGAIDILRTKGLSAAAKKAGRAASEGLIGVQTTETSGTIVEINSETDFVARNDTFQSFVRNVTSLALEVGGDFNTLKNSDYGSSGRTVEEEATQMVATIGENINLRRSTGLVVDKGLVSEYVHNKVSDGLGKIGVLVALESDAGPDQISQLGKNLAMHICSADPQSVDIESLDPRTVERERKILSDQALESGKNEEIIKKMVDGRIRKFYQESVLLEQTYVLDTDKTVADAIKEVSVDVGSDIVVKGYVRYNLGEGLEAKEDDFAEEVARLSE